MSTLITGASGFVGLHWLELLLARGETVVGLSAAALPAAVAARFARLPGRFHEVVGDVRDTTLLAELMATHAVRRVAHMAAITAAAEREKQSADTILDVNLVGLARVIKASADAGVERFLYVSSIAVFGGMSDDGSLIEEDAPHAASALYAITKSAGESITARLAALHGLDYVIGRLGRVFGPYEYATGVRDTLSQVFQATALARARQPFGFVRPCIKNWNYGPDAAANLDLLLFAPSHAHAVYNLGTPHAWSLASWCTLMAQRLPGVDFAVGAAHAGRGDIDLGGARDAGLLSWQRFSAEFKPPPPHTMERALDDYFAFLDAETLAAAPLPKA
jgi:nucleoside-diphosphate-sugar epimerase